MNFNRLSPHAQEFPTYEAGPQPPLAWPSPWSPALAITHVTVIDATGAPARPDATVVVAGGVIQAVGPAHETAVPSDAVVVNGRGRFLIPGLWDMHVHTAVGFEEPPPAEALSDMKDMLVLFVTYGITGVRDMGGWGTTTVELKKLAASGAVLSPTLVVGAMVDGPDTAHLGYIHHPADPQQARQLVRELRDQGFDFVKAYSFLSLDTYRALVDESKRLGLPVAGHVPLDVGFAEVSKLGQDSVEHMGDMFQLEIACSRREHDHRAFLDSPLEDDAKQDEELAKLSLSAISEYDEKKCSALIAQLAQAQTWMVPTLSTFRLAEALGHSNHVYDAERDFLPFNIEAFWSRSHFDWWRPSALFHQMQQQQRPFYTQRLREMARAGVPILAGTDTPMYTLYPGLSLHHELEDLVSAGLTPMEALQAATWGPARFLQTEESSGTLEVNKRADLVLLRANPLEDIRNTLEIESVVLHGHLLTRHQLDQLREGVRRRSSEERFHPRK